MEIWKNWTSRFLILFCSDSYRKFKLSFFDNESWFQAYSLYSSLWNNLYDHKENKKKRLYLAVYFRKTYFAHRYMMYNTFRIYLFFYLNIFYYEKFICDHRKHTLKTVYESLVCLLFYFSKFW